jgi:DNA-binding transcriptional LysR family regulator
MIERWDDLRFLLALAREQTLTAVATALRVSQPCASPKSRSAENC